MIRGYLLRRRPFVNAVFQFPALNNALLRTRLLIDTGADQVTFVPSHVRLEQLAAAYGFDFYSLPQGPQASSAGGASATRIIEAVLALGDQETSRTVGPVEVRIIEPPPSREVRELPPLLGARALAQASLCLVLDDRTNRVLLLEPDELDRLGLP